MKPIMMSFKQMFENSSYDNSTLKLLTANVDIEEPPEKEKLEMEGMSKEDVESLAEVGILRKRNIQSTRIKEIEVTYEITPIFSRYGIESIEFTLKKTSMIIEYEKIINDLTDDTEYDEIELVDEGKDINTRCKIKEINTLPFELANIEVWMNYQWDPSKFRYEVIIGESGY